MLSLRWTFRAKRACVVSTDAEPARLAPLTPPAPMGLRGVWVVAARCCANPPARCCADAVERSFACPSANLRAPSRRSLNPRSVRRRPAAISPRGERIRSRHGCWHCCADRAAPPSPPSRAPPAGNRTRCAPSWPPWCARSSGSGWSRRRRTASACIGLLPAIARAEHLRETDCVAGHVRFELRNVVANYPFEKSRRFGGIQPNSGPGDHSHLSCGAGDTQLEAGFYRGSPASVLHGRWPSFGVAEKIRIGRDLFRSEDDPAAAKPATP